MKPRAQAHDAFELFQAHFDQILNPKHELIQLARKIDWPRLEVASATTNRSNWIVASGLLANNPYDRHTLAAAGANLRKLFRRFFFAMMSWRR